MVGMKQAEECRYVFVDVHHKVVGPSIGAVIAVLPGISVNPCHGLAKWVIQVMDRAEHCRS
ncbi:hypothetical protein [Cyclobacterium xiamenense]|jgi:hypothetical protein|uniref:hypothetical protein n=1 Tax=Cyclobacterium xiamenense TaxID=1297121 RepID=UPI0012B7638F|nr:hypothetical protein [Cyclobacterium xiamenense]